MSKPGLRRIGQLNGPIKTLDDLRIRCSEDEITGCWIWQGGASSDGLGRLVLDGKVISVLRAAAILGGKQLHPGWLAFGGCRSANCANPEHVRTGTRAQKGAFDIRTGKLRGNPEKQASSLRSNRARRALTPEQVIEVCNSDETLVAAAKRLGVGKTTILSARHGKYSNETINGSSVFSWRPA